MGDSDRLTAKQFQESGGVEDWRVLAFGANAWFDAPSHAAGAALVRRVADWPAAAGRMPDVDLRAGGVHVRIGAAGASGLTAAMWRWRGDVGGGAGPRPAADPSALQDVQLAIDALDKPSVMAFWHAALGYDRMGDDDLVDPMRRTRRSGSSNRISHVRSAIGSTSTSLAPNCTRRRRVRGRRRRRGPSVSTTRSARRRRGERGDIVPARGDLDDGPETADWSVLFGAMTLLPRRRAVARRRAGCGRRRTGRRCRTAAADRPPPGGRHDRHRQGPVGGRAISPTWPTDPGGGTRHGTGRGPGSAAVRPDRDRRDRHPDGPRAFWRAVLGYELDPAEYITDIYDPRRLNLPVFFQPMDASEEDRRRQRNRIHVDVFVPDDQAQARIDAALAAGGRIVYDAEAPEWWTLADPEGNEVDIAVSVGREELWQAAREEGRLSLSDVLHPGPCSCPQPGRQGRAATP